MQKSRALFRTGFISILVFSIILCSFTTGMVRHNISQATPFQTVPPINATLPTPIGTQTPVATPIPTLGPGQYFEEGELDPSQINILFGDETFGYGQFLDNDDLYVMWVTDENGTHYVVVDGDDDILFGPVDEQTNSRREDESFKQFIIDRDELLLDLKKKDDDVSANERARDTKLGVGFIIAGAGLVICGILTGGACAVAIGLAVPASITFLGGGAVDESNRRSEIDRGRTLYEEIDKIEEKLSGKFESATLQTQNP